MTKILFVKFLDEVNSSVFSPSKNCIIWYDIAALDLLESFCESKQIFSQTNIQDFSMEMVPHYYMYGKLIYLPTVFYNGYCTTGYHSNHYVIIVCPLRPCKNFDEKMTVVIIWTLLLYLYV